VTGQELNLNVVIKELKQWNPEGLSDSVLDLILIQALLLLSLQNLSFKYDCFLYLKKISWSKIMDTDYP